MTENKLVCPFCQQELCKDNPQSIECRNDNCKESFFMYGSKELWQALIDTKKKLDDLSDKNGKLKSKLDIAVDKLKGIKAYYDDSYADPHTFVNWYIVAERLANDANDALEQINAIKGSK